MSNIEKGPDYIFRKSEEAKQNKAKRHVRKRIVILMVLFVLAVLGMIYYYSPLSRITYINISGNDKISESEILKLIEVREGDLRVKATKAILRDKLDNNPFIASFESNIDLQGRLNLVIHEKEPIAYVMEDNPLVLFSDKTTLKLTSAQYKWIMNIPLLKDFNETEYETMTDVLLRVDKSIRSNIAEVVKSPVSYNTEMIYFAMDDGNYMFMDWDLSKNLNYYYDILKQHNNKKSCIYIDDASQNAYTSNCPWEEVEEPMEEDTEDSEDSDSE